MTPRALKDHGREIIETAKDHLVAALASAPAAGWTAAEWADAAGVLIDGAKFPAVLAHHVAPVLVSEGRILLASEDGGIARYGAAAPRSTPHGTGRVASATAAPQVWAPATDPTDETGESEIVLSPPVVSSGHGPT
ncbi:MAG: hypothetical protein KDA24_00880 [Deltaproteobacteria bacterium]|nr:hypothetical protein [Deltaproteobacteria bacterium]